MMKHLFCIVTLALIACTGCRSVTVHFTYKSTGVSQTAQIGDGEQWTEEEHRESDMTHGDSLPLGKGADVTGIPGM